MKDMKNWNEKRLSDFFRANFDSKTCQCKIENEKLIVVDSDSQSMRFEIKDNRIFSPDTNKFYM